MIKRKTALGGFGWRMAAWGLVLVLFAAWLTYRFWFDAPYLPIRDVVYGMRDSKQLLLDVFRPPQQNRAAVIVVISGSWKSSPDSVQPILFAPFLRKGYTVFAVRHLSQPQCQIQDITQDLHRAIRFIRFHSQDYGVDPQRFGIIGGSSGGHLTLHVATCGAAGPSDAVDPVDRESSAVQCAACFYPVTDLLNLGKSTENPGDGGPPKSFKKGFGPRGQVMADWRVLGRELSPIYHITARLPPIYIIHGDADTLVPLEQSEWFVEKAKEIGRSIKLDVRPGKKHGWPSMIVDIVRFSNWFDRHLCQ